MNRTEADSLASAVRDAVPRAGVVVQRDGEDWLVEVSTVASGVFTLYDEDDWSWLERDIVRAVES